MLSAPNKWDKSVRAWVVEGECQSCHAIYYVYAEDGVEDIVRREMKTGEQLCIPCYRGYRALSIPAIQKYEPPHEIII